MHEPVQRPLQNWIPRKLLNTDGIPKCQWLYVADIPYAEPFFDETIQRCQSLPYNSSPYKVVSTLDILPEWSKQVESIAPSAFIFHVSRCGSTLVSQMLGLNPENISLAEVPFLDEILRLKIKGIEQDEEKIDELFGAALQFYGAKRTGKEKRLFVKTDSWHFLFYAQLRALFPDTPFIILYRAPEEVLYSQQRRRGIQAVPGVLEPGLFNFSTVHATLDAYMGMVLERYYNSIIDILQKDNNCLLLNYSEGIAAMMDKIAACTGMPVEDAYREQIKERSHYHAKEPQEIFKEKYATELLDIPNMAQLHGLYKHIETIRTGLYQPHA